MFFTDLISIYDKNINVFICVIQRCSVTYCIQLSKWQLVKHTGEIYHIPAYSVLINTD